VAQGKKIDELEKVLEGQQANTPEAQALKANLVVMREEWQTKMTAARTLSSSLFRDVVRFKEYEQRIEKLEPFLQQMETAATAVSSSRVQCDSLDKLQERSSENKVICVLI